MSSGSAPFRPRRDRHGRGLRGPLAWPPVPAMATRAPRFDELVLAVASRMEHHAGPANVWLDPREHLEISKEDALQIAAKQKPQFEGN